MEWTKFNTHGESCNRAFEVMCNLLFEAWCKKEYGSKIINFAFINGIGGDGGIEAYAILENGDIIGVQSKWFREKIEDSQIRQIESSFLTAIKVRPQIIRYIVCIPRDLGSKRIVKGGKISQNTEEDRWNKLIASFKGMAPNVKVELWNETRIQELITWPELQGIHSFWFDNSEIFVDCFALSYRKAMVSWAKTNYIPDLYAEGYIHQKIEWFLGSLKLTEQRYQEWSRMCNRLSELKRAFEDLLSLDFPDKEKELISKIKRDLSSIDEWISMLKNAEELVRRGLSVSFDKDLKLECTIDLIKKSTLHYHRYFHFHSVETLLDNLAEDVYCFEETFRENDSNRLILLGNPGSGKTTGIVSETGAFLVNKTHLPVLVHAKEFAEGETWGTIIEKTLGLSASWDEKELLFSLECAAQLERISSPGQYDMVSNCVICVDGIDESESWDFWKRRIEEVAAYKDLYPRIKFVFLSRPYVFKDYYKLSYRNDFHSIPYYGDIKPEELCDAYFKKYQISVGKNIWIKRLLRSPISVNLFCDIYKGTDVENVDNNTTVITKLFRKKIEILEERFDRHVKGDSRGIVQSVLSEIAQMFTENDRLSGEELRQKLNGQNNDYLTELLKFLEEEGFIYSFKRQKDDFSPVSTYYSWGMQPAFDYLIARKLFETIERDEQIEIEYTTGIYEMLSLILIEERGKLLYEYKNINVEDGTLFDLVCYTLANASIRAAVSHRCYLKKILMYSVDQFRELVNRVIIPNCIVDKHPLGAELLDEFLRGFNNSAERDIWWSIPAHLKDSYNADWRAHTDIGFEEVSLSDDDVAETAPLVLAWSLSSVNNDVRRKSRMKLITWGLKHSLEYWALLCRFSDVDDEQVLEDIFAVAYGIALDQFTPDDYLGKASEWILENVFSPDGLGRYENSAIRYYCSCIVKIAICKGLKEKDVKNIITPPYSYNTDDEELAVEAISAERMGGYKAIDYDLSRYVLCDQLNGFFRTNSQKNSLEEDSAAFIEKYRIKYDIDELSVDGLIISMAYQYLIECGWDPEIFWHYDDPDNCGVDIAIRRTYYHATHGSMSRIMTVAEKNIWLAKHHMECVMANEIVYRDWGTDSDAPFLDDYSYLENFINPYQDYVNKNHIEKEERWYHMDLLARSRTEEMDKTSIEAWMKKNEIPDFKSWIEDNNGLIMIYSFSNARNDYSGIEESIWISNGIVEATALPKLIECLKTYSEERTELLSVSGFHAGLDCKCYCTPQEACLVHSDKEIEASLQLSFDDEIIEVKKSTVRCLSADEMDTEKTFYLPSSFVRCITGISFGNGFEYKNKEGEVIASFISNGENWGTQQEALLIDQDIFINAINERGLKLFWIFRVYKSPSNKAYERYPEILHDTDTSYIVWMEENGLKYMALDDIEPPKREHSSEALKELNIILNQLEYTVDGKNEKDE